MVYSRMVASIIIDTFGSEVGRWGGHGTRMPAGTPQEALLVEFRTPTDYDIEDGYRYIDMLIYADANYIGVYVRDRWSVWSDQGAGPGCDCSDCAEGAEIATVSGVSEWRCLAYHDSCWTEGVERFLCNWKPADGEAPVGSVQDIFGRRLDGFSGLERWYKIVEVDKKMQTTLSAARDAKYHA